MTIINTQFLLLSLILKTRLDEVYPNLFIAFRIMLNFPDTVASTESSFSKLNLIQDFSDGALGPLGGHGAVLWEPRAEAFIRQLCRDIA